MQCVWIFLFAVSAVSAFPPASVAGPCSTQAPLVPAIDVTAWPDAPFRWKDIATNLYAQSYRESYLYDSASVSVTWDTYLAVAFTGHVSAVDLKPNFAYQMKLVGKPAGIWGVAGDDETNERIGYAGRWWRHQPNPGNANDADYEAHKDDPAYIYEGYIMFDFFLTDRFGAAEVNFTLASSGHVLWWEGQRTKQPCDSPTKWRAVTGLATDPAYDADVGPIDVGVYAEIERLCWDGTAMAAGDYDCRLVLTEESFHQAGSYEGQWLSVMVCDTITFTIVDPTGVEDVGTPVGAHRFGSPWPNPFRGATKISLGPGASGEALICVYDVRGRLIRTLWRGHLDGHTELTWTGRDDAGRNSPAGAYLISLTGDGWTSTRKAVLLR